MTIHARLVVVSIALLMWTGAFAAEEQPAEAKRKLHFVKSDRSVFLGPRNLEITHRAQLFLKPDRKFAHPAAVAANISDRPVASCLSEEQRALLARTGSGQIFLAISQYYRDMNTPLGMYTVDLHAVSEQDARKMAEFFLGDLDLRAAHELKALEESVKYYREEIPKLETKITELGLEHGKTSLELERLRQTFHYQGFEDAQKSIADFRGILRAVGIDIIGIKAKINAINRTKSKQDLSPEIYAALDRLMVMQDIEMAGALARKRAAEEELDKAERFSRLIAKQSEITKEQNKLKQDLEICKRRLPQDEKRLANPPARMRPVSILDNKVTIYPVEVDSDK